MTQYVGVLYFQWLRIFAFLNIPLKAEDYS